MPCWHSLLFFDCYEEQILHLNDKKNKLDTVLYFNRLKRKIF